MKEMPAEMPMMEPMKKKKMPMAGMPMEENHGKHQKSKMGVPMTTAPKKRGKG